MIGCFWLLGCRTERLPSEEKQSLDRAISFVEEFKSSYSRLPNRDEYVVWWKTNTLIGVIDYQIAGSAPTNEYVLYLWLGERMVKYSSKQKRIIEP